MALPYYLGLKSRDGLKVEHTAANTSEWRSRNLLIAIGSLASDTSLSPTDAIGLAKSLTMVAAVVPDLPDVTGLHVRTQKNALLLLQFLVREGHCLVSQSYKEDGVALGRWVKQARVHHRKGVLCEKTTKSLDALPRWRWQVRNQTERQT